MGMQVAALATLWALWVSCNDFWLRFYGFTDLRPSLPLPPADPRTRTRESSYRRISITITETI